MATRVTRNKSLSRLAMTTALTGMAMFGYGRGAYAGDCAIDSGGQYFCQGIAQSGSDSTQDLSGSPLAVTTSETFAINVAGSAIELDGEGGITFETPTYWEGFITGSEYGIDAENDEGGNILITTTNGAVTGTEDTGIRLRNGDDGGSESTITITTGDVTGGRFGIDVYNDADVNGDSSVTIDTTAGTVTAGGTGIFVDQNAYSFEGDVNLTVVTGDVTSDSTGVEVNSEGDSYFGDADVLIDTTRGTIDSGANGIVVFTDSEIEYGDANITVLSGNITSGNTGVEVSNSNDVYSGDTNVEIDTTGGIIQSNYAGIVATNDAQTGSAYTGGDSNLTITAGAIVAGGDGIIDGDGIDALQRAQVRYGDANLEINATGPIEAEGTGLDVNMDAHANEGTAHVTITTGDVTAENGAGIDVFSNAFAYFGSDIEITTTGGVVTAGGDGILVENYGQNDGGSSNVIITTGVVTGGGEGIEVRNRATSDNGTSVTITATGAVTGQDGDGISVDNDGGTYTNIVSGGYGVSNVTVTATDVTGIDGEGIDITNRTNLGGSSNITVTTTGTVTSLVSAEEEPGGDYGDYYDYDYTYFPDAIDIDNFASVGGTSDITVTTNIVSGADDGISIYNAAVAPYGSNIVVTTNGAVTGHDDDGIDIFQAAAASQGTANVTVTANSNVTGYESGIEIDVGDGYGYGPTYGYLGTNVVVTTLGGNVVGQTDFGIDIESNADIDGGPANITVTTANVNGADDAIRTLNYADANYGSNVTINTVAGAVLSSDGRGIQVENYGESEAGTSNISITTGNVTGDDEGIEVLNLGNASGDTNVIVNTAAGVVTGGADHDGILVRTGYYDDGYVYYASSLAGSANVEITTGIAVTGGNDGIDVQHYATALVNSNITITTTAGAVTGSAGDGCPSSGFFGLRGPFCNGGSGSVSV